MTEPQALIRLGIDDAPATSTLKNLTANFGHAAIGINQGLEIVGKAWDVIAGTAKAAVGVMLIATTAAVGVGEAYAEVSTIADKAQFPIAQIRDISLDLTKHYGGDTRANAKALYQTISAGVTDSAKAVDLLNVASELSIGGVTDLTTSVDGLTNVTNSYAATNLTARDAADTFFVAVRDGKTTVEELARGLGQVSPLAAQLGVDFPDLAAAVATITTNGVATSEAITQVRSALVAVTKSTPAAQKVAKDLGIDFSLTALKAKGLRDFMHDVVIESGATETELVRLFGRVEAVGAALSLTANNGAKFDQILGDMEARAGSAEAAFAQMSATLGFQVRRFESLREASRVALGEMVTGSTQAVAGLAEINEIQVKLIELLGSPAAHAVVDKFFGTIRTGLKDTIGLYLELDQLYNADFVLAGFALEEADALTVSLRELDAAADVARATLISTFTLGVFGDIQGEWDEFMASLEGPPDSVIRDAAESTFDYMESGTADAVANGVREGLDAGLNLSPDRFQALTAAFSESPWQSFLREEKKKARAGRKKGKTPFEEELAAVESGGLEFGRPRRDELVAAGGIAPGDEDSLLNQIAKPTRTIQVRQTAELTPVGTIKDGLAGAIAEWEDGGLELAQAATTEMDRMVGAIEDAAPMIASAMHAGVADGITGMFVALGEGENVLTSIKGFFGDIIVQMGTMLIQLGTAGVMAGTLGTVIPAFAGLTGGALGVAGGLAAIAAGGTMVAVGTALGGSGGASTGPAPSTSTGGSIGGGGAPRSDRPGLPGLDEMFRGASGTAQSVTINVQVSGASGNPRRQGAEIVDAAREALTLEPFGAGGLGF